MKMRNEGALDRWLRGIVGLLLILSGPAVVSGGWIVEGIGAILIATAFIGWCPIYAMFHLNTRTVKH